MIQMAKISLIQFVWGALDMIWVQPQEGEYVVACYGFQHAPCRILNPQGSWAVHDDVGRSDIILPAILYSKNMYNMHIPCAWILSGHPSLVPKWYKGYSTMGLCHLPPRMKNQCGAQEENHVGERPRVGVRWTHVYVGSLTVTTNKRKSLWE